MTRHRLRLVNQPPSELAETLAQVNARYGAGSVCRASEIKQPGRISTGSFILDFCLLGGLPHNRISMIAGERSSGKTLLASKVIASAQQQFPEQAVIFLDIEGSWASTWAQQLGVDIDRLQIIPCETGEMAVDVADAVVRSKEASLLVIDSLAALVPMKEIESSADDNAQVALQARLIGSMIRKVTAGLITERKRQHYITVLFLNQFRNRIGMAFGDPRILPGGKALEFSTSVQLIIKNKEKPGKDARDIDTIEVNEHSFTITKNKLNAGPRTGEFRLVRAPDPELGLSVGAIDDAKTLLIYAKKFGAYQGGGSRWTLAFDPIAIDFRSVQEAIVYLYQQPAVYTALRNWVIREQARQLGMPAAFLATFGGEVSSHA